MKYRRLVVALAVAAGILGVASPTMAAVGASTDSAVTTTSPWQDVLGVSDPRPTLTVLDLQRMAEHAAQRPLAPADQAAVYASDRDPTWEELAAVAAGRSDPGIQLLTFATGVVPTTSIGDLTSGVPTAQSAVVRVRVVCRSDGTCRIKIRVVVH
jgi:hypothetical protein